MTVFKNAIPNTYAIDAISTIGLTNAVEALALAKLIKNLQIYNIWDKMIALYPFIGPDQTTQSWNLKDLRTTSDAYYLQFGSVLAGGWSHTAAGAKPNPISASYCDTQLVPNTDLTVNNLHVSIYTTEDETETAGFGAYDDGGAKNLAINLNNTVNSRTEALAKNTTASWLNLGNTKGLITLNNTAVNNNAGFQNQTKKNTNITTDPGTLPTTNFYLGALNTDNSGGGTAFHTSATISFASMGYGLTDSDVRYLYLTVQEYQTLLNRAV